MPPISLRPVLLACAIPFLISTIARAQTVSVGTSTVHDGNIFDIYLPTADQVTQVQLDVSTDWVFDQASLTASYNGAGEFFRDLPARNYHVHLLSFEALYHFEGAEDDDQSGRDDEPAAPDSGGSSPLGGSHAQPGGAQPTLAGAQSGQVHSDSADRFMSLALAGGSQFDKDEATEFGNPAVYNNSALEASAALRQPLGIHFGLRPSYTFSYHAYPNVSVISNLQHIVALQLGSDLLGGSWIALTPAYAFKSYTGSSTFVDTVSFRVSSGHGKGFGSGKGGIKVRTFVFASPSVGQVSLSLVWKQTVSPGTEVTAEYTRFGEPSGSARVIPEQLRGAAQDRGAIGGFTSQSEIFDDHFAFSADASALQLKQALPFGLTITAKEQVQVKTYTAPAMDLADSLTLGAHRNDHRYETDLTLSRPISLGVGKILKPEMEFHYLRNDSNAPYYVFDKSVLLLGIAFEF